jgi:hypothetical protein
MSHDACPDRGRLQAALVNPGPGDTVALEAGATYVENLPPPEKKGNVIDHDLAGRADILPEGCALRPPWRRRFRSGAGRTTSQSCWPREVHIIVGWLGSSGEGGSDRSGGRRHRAEALRGGEQRCYDHHESHDSMWSSGSRSAIISPGACRWRRCPLDV